MGNVLLLAVVLKHFLIDASQSNWIATVMIFDENRFIIW